MENRTTTKWRKFITELTPEKKNKLEKKWRKWGNFYGYPQCCIDAFCNKIYNPTPNSRDSIIVSQRTGFIPCYECTKKILSKQSKLEDLIQNRVCPKVLKSS